jgi:hypothetical protein
LGSASILSDTSENTMGSNTSTSSNGSTNNNASIKVENVNSYYCNSYAPSALQSAPPAITSITGGYSNFDCLLLFEYEN